MCWISLTRVTGCDEGMCCFRPSKMAVVFGTELLDFVCVSLSVCNRERDGEGWSVCV